MTNNSELSLTIPGYGQIQTPPDIPTGGITTTDGTTSTFESIFQTGIELLFVFGIILVLFYMFWGGLSWQMSRGDKSKIESARLKIIWSLIGLAVIFLSIIIVSTLGFFFGVEFFNFT